MSFPVPFPGSRNPVSSTPASVPGPRLPAFRSAGNSARFLAIFILAVLGAGLGLVSCSGGDNLPDGGSASALWLGGDWESRTDLKASEPFDLALLQKELSRQESREGTMVKGNIDLSSSTIQYFTQTSSDVQAGALPPETGALEIVDHGPEGELPIEQTKPTIYVMFNHPMVPLAKLGEPITSTDIMKLDPAVKGIYRWYGTKVLSFEPDAPLIDQPRYTVTVGKEAKSLGGSVLAQAYSFEFHTEPVKGVNFYVGNNPDQWSPSEEVPPALGRTMILEFNQTVDPAFVGKFLAVEADNQDLAFTVSRPAYPERLKSRTDRGLLITLAANPPENAAVLVHLADGASPRDGYPSRKGGQTWSFSTITPFKVKSLESYSWDLPRTNKPGLVPVYLQFSQPVDAKSANLAFKVKVNGEALTPKAVEVFDDVVRLGLEGVGPGDEVMVQAPPEAKDVYGRSLGSQKSSASVEIPRPNPIVDFPYGFHQLESAFDPAFIWESRNLDVVNLGGEGKAAYGFDIDDENVDWPAVKSVDTAKWKENKTNYNLVDLKPWLNKSGYGTVYFRWDASWTQDGQSDEAHRRFAIQVTDIGITSRYAYNRILVWARSLSTGKAIADADVVLTDVAGTSLNAKTDADGLARFDLKPGVFKGKYKVKYGHRLPVTVSKGADRADFLLGDTHNTWNDTSYGHSEPTEVENPRNRVFMFTDRGLYKPGEEIALRGIHWIQTPLGFTPYDQNYELSLKDPRSEALIWSQKGKASMSGGWAHTFKLPDDLEPGEYTINYHPLNTLNTQDNETVNFTIAQFRRLAFQVQTKVADRSFYAGDEISAEVSATYLAGGAMPQAPASWYWTRKPTAWAPSGAEWKGYVFGPGNWEGERTLSNGKSTLGGSGKTTIREKTQGQNASGSAYDYVLETTVQDVDRQAIASTAHVLVHPASFWIGARFASGAADGWWSRFVSTGQSVKVQGGLVDPAGASWNSGVPITATVTLGSWKETQQQGVYGRVNTRWEYVETEVSRQTVQASGGKFEFDFSVKDSGDYLLAIEGKDSQGRLARTVLRFYASGSEWVLRANETPSEITMILDKNEYMPGETARILVRSPVADGTYLMTLEREGIFEQKFITLKGGQTLLEVPVKENYLPVFYVALTSATKREAKPSDYFEPDLGRPRSLFGICGIRVSTKPVELDVEVMALKGAYKPGEKAEVAVKVSRGGKPVANAEVSILAVDRGVLDLIDYHVPNPLEFFYDPYNFPLGVNGDDSRRLLMKPVTYDTRSLTGGDGENGENGGDKEKTRKDFRPLALFEPFVATDKNGIAKVSFTLPDNLTTYRLTAVALRENRLGWKEGELLVQNPVNVRTALPRRWRNRDTAAAGVVLQNLTHEVQKVDVTVSSDILTVSGEVTKSVEIPADSVYELPFVLSATRPGEGKVSFSVKSSVLNEKLEEKVLVERPLIKEAFSTVGYMARESSSASEGLVIPKNIAPGYGSLALKASPGLAGFMQPALGRLLEAPDDWAGYQWRLAHGFAAAWTKDTAGLGRTSLLMSELAGRQQSDGGIYSGSYTFKPYLSDAYLSLVTAHYLLFAKDRKVSPAKAPELPHLLEYLAGLRSETEKYDPAFQAYIALVLATGGRGDRDWMSRLESEEDKLGLAGYGLLAQAWQVMGDQGRAKALYQRSKNFVLMGTQSVDLKDTYETASWWTSGHMELALLMKNALELGEEMELVQRMAAGLNKSDRYWQTRTDDLWTILSFIPLANREGAGKSTRLDFSTGGQNVASLDTGSRDKNSLILDFDKDPLARLERDKVLNLELKKSTDSPAAYTATLSYALPNETARARDEGFEVNQRWEAMDGSLVSEKDLKPGETYRVRIDVSSTKRRAHVELLAPVPSGVEIVDPSMKTTGRFADQGGSNSEEIERETVYGDTMDASAEGYGTFSDGDWYWYWYTPDSFALDNMMVYRWTDFYAGTRTISFLVRVTTPGIFPTPGASASLEFEPEVFGRADGKLFVIKP